ncbi:hypothetical protein [Lacipirellula limnantheis]|uniref:Uncharacterized protein n=1 Tax=Lacipirellula limnantheis TaxID=2528024 RepID=A0A517TVR0_9BACT|nr:hypothetical protein [Lacipirellula limnantheis]QDT72456.1 hypothetical protein I41_16340 [Lacipirellula limnantheis]
MALSKRILLQMLLDAGGVAKTYPFLSTGQMGQLQELLRDDLVVQISMPAGFDEVRITDNGREWLAGDECTP